MIYTLLADKVVTTQKVLSQPSQASDSADMYQNQDSQEYSILLRRMNASHQSHHRGVTALLSSGIQLSDQGGSHASNRKAMPCQFMATHLK